MSQGALPGFRDFYPQELAERSYIMNAWRTVVRRYAFVEYDGPPLEPLELYTRKSGDEIVGQLYNFEDKGGREVALRPEMTPTFARMVAARANALRKPVRWFSMPQLFRYERQQKGRLREHFQLNVDIVGEADVTADAELLAVAIDVMRELGLGPDDVEARVSDRRILHGYLLALGVAEESMAGVYGVVDKLERQPREISDEKLASLGVPESARPAILDVGSATLELVLDQVERHEQEVMHALGGRDTPRPAEGFVRYLEYLKALGVSDFVRFDLSIVRGLAYYTGIVFELFDRKGEFRAICGGGRYDNLLAALGGVDQPALGFGMGDVVLGELLRSRGLMRPPAAGVDYWVAGEGEGEQGALDIMRVAAALRARGRSVEYALRAQKVDKQRKAAQSAGARRFVVLRAAGADGTATVRSLEDGAEETVRLDEWLAGA